jgi:ribosomal RNA-processing protein 36
MNVGGILHFARNDNLQALTPSTPLLTPLRMKQQSKERKRGLRVMHRLDSLHREERQKVKEGKKPFFMKRAVVEHVSLEERYKELRKEGKLGKFMEKRRKKDASKDRRWLPGRRGADE